MCYCKVCVIPDQFLHSMIWNMEHGVRYEVQPAGYLRQSTQVCHYTHMSYCSHCNIYPAHTFFIMVVFLSTCRLLEISDLLCYSNHMTFVASDCFHVDVRVHKLHNCTGFHALKGFCLGSEKFVWDRQIVAKILQCAVSSHSSAYSFAAIPAATLLT